ADHVASAIAGALEAEKLVYLTNVEGLRARASDPSSLIHQVSSDEVESMISREVITGGMIPKVRSAIEAIKGGVRSVHLLDGTMAHALLLEIFTDKGIGTMIHV
ncbi:MAG: acetylglutamate kinase, partial [Acidimicrobiales bacterium]